jgi:hypothetical protein
LDRAKIVSQMVAECKSNSERGSMSDSMKKLIDELCAALYELGEVADEAWRNGKQYADAWQTVRRRWDSATAPLRRVAEVMDIPVRLCRIVKWREVGVEVWVLLGEWSISTIQPLKFRKFVRRLTRGIRKLVKKLHAINPVCQEAIPVLHAVAEALAPRAAMEKLCGETERVVNQ